MFFQKLPWPGQVEDEESTTLQPERDLTLQPEYNPAYLSMDQLSDEDSAASLIGDSEHEIDYQNQVERGASI